MSEPLSAQQLFSTAAITSFRLNGQLLAVAEELARPAGLTAAWWQVLGAVLGGPFAGCGLAPAVGVTRPSVGRLADGGVGAFFGLPVSHELWGLVLHVLGGVPMRGGEASHGNGRAQDRPDHLPPGRGEPGGGGKFLGDGE